ncbi:hypothetical protein FJ364_00860 [Candidatus Dependentiae bacterium]|nr:hypothetical protein [Candidatus Dependentiae bacterium]
MVQAKNTVLGIITLMVVSFSVISAHQAEITDRYNAILHELKTIDSNDLARINQLNDEKEKLLALLAGENDVVQSEGSVKIKDNDDQSIGIASDILILKTKIEAVFQRFVDVKKLGLQDVVLLETMQLYFNEKLSSFDQATAENQSFIKTEIFAFVESARLLRSKLQLLSVNAKILNLHFSSLLMRNVDEYKLDGFFIQILHEYLKKRAYKEWIQKIHQAWIEADQENTDLNDLIYSRINKLVSQEMLNKFVDEELIDLHTYSCLGWKMSLTDHPMYSVVMTIFDASFIDLVQRYFDLEEIFKEIPILNAIEQKTLVARFVTDAEALMAAFLVYEQHNEAVSVELKQWINLFISKIIVLKRDFLVRLHVTQHMEKEALSKEVYFKHIVLLKDPQYEVLSTVSNFKSYVNRYENLIMRFLSGQIEPKLDFYCEHYALLSHLKTVVAKNSPSIVGTYVFSRGDGRYVSLLKAMIEVLESIEKTVKSDDGIVTATQNLVAHLLGDNGALSGDAKAGSLGLTPDQLKSILGGTSNGNMKDVLLRVAAYVSPLLLKGLMGNNNQAKEASENKKAAFVAVQAPRDLASL